MLLRFDNPDDMLALQIVAVLMDRQVRHSMTSPSLRTPSPGIEEHHLWSLVGGNYLEQQNAWRLLNEAGVVYWVQTTPVPGQNNAVNLAALIPDLEITVSRPGPEITIASQPPAPEQPTVKHWA